MKPYPLATCLVTGENLDEWDEQATYVHNNQEMKFCCKVCLGKFKKALQQNLWVNSGSGKSPSW